MRRRLRAPYGLPDDWAVVNGPMPGTEFAVGPGGVFLLDRRRVAPEDTARIATELAGHLTSQTGTYVNVHPVIVEDGTRQVRTDQPPDATIVAPMLLRDWLRSHPRTFDPRQIVALRHALPSAG